MATARSESDDKQVVKLPYLIEKYSMSRSSIYRAMAEEDFPLPIKLSSRSVGWWLHQVEEWFANRPSAINPCADHQQYQTEGYLTSRPGARPTP